jgi:hypothetical protein
MLRIAAGVREKATDKERAAASACSQRFGRNYEDNNKGRPCDVNKCRYGEETIDALRYETRFFTEQPMWSVRDGNLNWFRF